METEPQDDVLLRHDDRGVCWLTFNRPEQLNVLSNELLDALEMQFAAITRDRQVRVVVIAAAGKAFCAGHDLKQMRSQSELAQFQALFSRCAALMQSMQKLPQPIIARVQGVATAAGCQLVASCDLAVASSSAKFAVSGINLGLFCSTPAVALSRAILAKQAFDLLVTGRFIDANTAVEYGLINRAVPERELNDMVQYYATSICRKAAKVVTLGKQLFYQQLEKNINEAYPLAVDVMANNMLEADAIEGIDAFLQKRGPKWSVPE